MGLYGNLTDETTNKPFKLPSNFLCEVNERYTCTRVCYDATSQAVAYLATRTASQQRLNVHTCNYPGLEFISKGKISSVKENN